MAALLAGMAPAAYASTHPAKAATAANAIHLAGEADVVIALVAQLEEAVRLSSTMAATSRTSPLHGFAQKEIKKRTGQITQLRKWCRRWFDDSCSKADAASLTQNTPINDLTYASAMSANHARLLEVIEFGFGLKPRKAARELMEQIQKESYDELAFLEQSAGTPAGRPPQSRNKR
ncbi:MAG: hypothetical protein K2X06_17620 [Burkholderiales bacterium]|nr:hypothetical protein [Burkholderiales bacterium]